MCPEDVKAQCNSLTLRTRERLQAILSQGEVDINTNVSLAHAHGYLKISRHPLLRVHRDVPVICETFHETETDPFSGPADCCVSVTDELDIDPSVSKTRKRRRLLRKSHVSARFLLDDCDEDDDTSAQADCFMPVFVEASDEKRPAVGKVRSTASGNYSTIAAMESTGHSDEVKHEGHEHTVQLLRKGGDDGKLAIVKKGQRRNFSSMTKVLSTIIVAAQFLDSSCADCWNRAIRFGRPDLLEICATNDSPLVNAVEDAGGEGLRASFWNGYDLTTRRGRERLYVFCSAKRPRHVWFSLPSRVPGASSQRVSRILQGIADVVPRVQALGCHVHFSQPHSSISWNRRFLSEMTEKTLKAVVNGCAWGLRDSQGSLLNQYWQIMTTSPEVQRVLNHRPCDQRHRHGRHPDHFCALPLQFPQSLCRTLAKQFLAKDSWNSALGILEQLHPDDDERPFDPSASSSENPTCFDAAPSRMDVDCRLWSHLLLRRVRPCLREKKLPSGYRKFINRSDIVTTAHL